MGIIIMLPFSYLAAQCIEGALTGVIDGHLAGWKSDRPATAFVCQNFTCKAPTTSPEKLRASLKEAHEPAKRRPLVQQVDLSSLSKEASKDP